MKITKGKKGPEKITMKTRPAQDASGGQSMLAEWWKATDDRQLAAELCGTAAYLKTNQTYRMRQLAVSIRLYCNLPVYSSAGSNVARMDRTRTLPEDVPTFNLVQVGVDTLVSRIGQNEPAPKFLTDGADYKERHRAQQLNQFVLGEFYQTKAYIKSKKMFRDGLTVGPGALKIYEGDNNKVAIDRVLTTDLYVDDNDSLNADPQQLYQLKLMDRDKLIANTMDKKAKAVIGDTPEAYPDNATDTGRTTADQIMVVEGWKLPSGDDPEAPGYVPGRHTIATMNGIIFDEEWNKPKFPFVFFNYADPFLGFWGQGIATQLFGTQMALKRVLHTITKAITLVGVPRVFQEMSSGVVSSHHNDQVGVIVKYKGIKPTYEVAPCNAPELYAERDKLIEYGLRQIGVSDMQATGEKPAGLDSGEAVRSYDDINSDRFSETAKKYDQIYIDLAYHIVDVAMDIAKREGKYQTVYPNKDGTKEIDLPKMTLLKNPFVIQCFNESSLPRTPAGRYAAITERVQAGMLSIKEGRRLLHTQDTEQNEKLDNASEERIFQILDNIVDSGKYTPPDPFIDLELATTLVVQYINLYLAANLEEEKADMLRTFFTQVQALKAASVPPPVPGAAPMPQASPEAPPTSPLVPNSPNPQGAAA